MTKAHEEQDASLRFHGDPALRAAVVADVRARIGWPELGISQDETVQVLAVDGERVRYTYTFDHDFCSQYDRTESWEGEVVVGGGQVAD